MRPSFAITRTLLLVALVGAFVAAGIALRAQQQNAQGLQQASKESLFWSAVQVEVELSRFTSALGQYALGAPGVSRDSVNARFDILWSRVALFRQGDVGRRLNALDANGVIQRLHAELLESEAAVMAIDTASRGDVAAMVSRFSAFGDELRAFSIRVIRAEENRLADVRAMVRTSSTLTLAATGAVLAIALLLVLLLLYESRRFRIDAEQSAALAERAEAAARVKSRFLTMMSHELRTPMNGVMGMLALARQTSLTEAQARLIDQAQRSGGQMVSLLTDMLDLSDLQAERHLIEREAFRLADLREEIARRVGPRVERGAVAFICTLDPDTPCRVVGDFPRLARVTLHLVGHLIEEVGCCALDLHLRHRGGVLSIEMSAAVNGAAASGWRPDPSPGHGVPGSGGFASNGLATMIAQGFVELMGGRIEVRQPEGGCAILTVHVPSEVLPEPTRTLLIDVRSPALAAVLDALVRSHGWRSVRSGADAISIDATLFSADGRDEADEVMRLRSRWRGAPVFAIGMPDHPALFDRVIALPVTQAALAEAFEPADPAIQAVS